MIRTRLAYLALLLAISGTFVGSTRSAFNGATVSKDNSFRGAADWTAPKATASTIAPEGAGTAGTVTAGTSYFVYADVGDEGGPASGVNTVTADVSAFTSGSTAVPLTAGNFLRDGVSYNRRSGSLTAAGALPAGTYSYTLALTDTAGNARVQNGFSAKVVAPNCTTPGTQTVIADRDASIRQDGSANLGLSDDLKVLSEDDGKNMRVLVAFPLPSIPAGCTVTTATLRLYNRVPTAGRSIEARRVTGAWTETGVTWQNHPAAVDPAALSTTVSSPAWQTWTVTDHVNRMYTDGNHGFMLRDQVESLSSRPDQTYRSRQDTTDKPQLIVEWG